MKIFLPELTESERLLVMEQNANDIEQASYFRALTPDELDAKREQLTNNAIRLSECDDEKKAILQEMKALTDPLIKENKALLLEVKTRHAEVKGKLFHIADYENNYMETYNEAGEMIASRRLRPDEKQPNIFNINQQKQAL